MESKSVGLAAGSPVRPDRSWMGMEGDLFRETLPLATLIQVEEDEDEDEEEDAPDLACEPTRRSHPACVASTIEGGASIKSP